MKIAIVPVSQMTTQLRIWQYERELIEAENKLLACAQRTQNARGHLRSVQQQLWNQEVKKWATK